LNTHEEQPAGRRLFILSLTAMGIVYGDIGTSPLYAMRECFFGSHPVPVTTANVFGILSLILWSLVIIVTVKYHVYVLRFDNRGEGGILALMGLVGVGKKRSQRTKTFLTIIGVFGAALLYGDGMITPAISVLSAIEGLEIATPFFKPYIIPLTLVILVMLFLFQRRGTAGVGAVFGPVILVWFGLLAVLGVGGIVREPSVLRAVNPMYAVHFFAQNGFRGFLVLGAVFLVATGGEALYADLGHFGERPIQIDWFSVVAPSLILNYFGQGALLIRNPAAAHNPFYLLAPTWALYPLVVLATFATVIASQAIISGVFSLTRQAIQLGYLPRMEIIHTSHAESGQIYLPAVNRALMVATMVLVVGFRTSTNLASAYGIAVSSTMVITTLLTYFVSREVLGWGVGRATFVTTAFLIVDFAFFGANLAKIADGGWFPLLIASLVFTVMMTWRRGREILNERLREGSLSIELFLESLRKSPPVRVPGTAVFMTRNDDGIPAALLHSLKHYKVLHESVVLLSVLSEEVSQVQEEERHSVTSLGDGLFRIIVRFGFMEEPLIPPFLERIETTNLHFDPAQTSYFLGRETLIVTDRPGMAKWREHLFASMARNASSASRFFDLPPNRVVELGSQIEF
jgi:KUP system potassium uptake protein